MKRYFSLLGLVILLQTPVQTVFAQNSGNALIDSLLSELPKAGEETGKVVLLLDLCYEYERTNYTTAIEYGNRALILSKKLKWKRGIAKSYICLGYHYRQFSYFEKSIDFYLKALHLSEELKECFTAFDNIIERNGLGKIKTISDAYLAVCGLPAADQRHAQRTVQAVLEIRDFIEERSKKEKTFPIRIGIHSGSVVAGIVGVKKYAYDIWGDTVNTVARMEQSGEAGKIKYF